MFKKQITKPLPPEAQTRVIDGKTEARVRTGGRMQWVPVNGSGRIVLFSSHWYAKVGGLPVKLARDKAAAEQILANKRKHLERVEAGLDLPELPPSEEAISAVLDRWDKEREENDRSPGYRLRQKKRVAELLAEMAVTAVHQIPRLQLERIERAVSTARIGIRGAKGPRGKVEVVSATTVVRTHNIIALSIFFSWLKARKLIGVIPELPRRSKLTGVRAAITIDQLQKLVENMRNDYKAFYLLAFATLARVGSLAALRIKDCHFEFKNGSRDPQAGTISLLARHSKTKKPNRIPVAKDFALRPLYLQILERREAGATDEDLVFTFGMGKLPEKFKRQMANKGLPTNTPDGKITPHSLRHGGATHLLLHGVSPFKVMKIGGWKNMDVLVKHYGHVISTDASEEVDKYMKWNKP